ncbi:growth/differentiation factor 8-like [Asterias rubens]|uniref:growth/differentiation factor 8-like n=1 Tax=Asterias rubens TaxID=7604 RepID=UPI0014553EAF|nr:growth/differentiation factor 8-like [Asterias rubens]
MKHLQVLLPIAVMLQLLYLACLARQLPSNRNTRYSISDFGSSSSERAHAPRTSRGKVSRAGSDATKPPMEDISLGEYPSEKTRTRITEPVNNNRTEQQQEPPRCGACEMRAHQRALRIESIKETILRKLDLRTVPNITSPIPKIPPLQHLLERDPGMSSMQGDSPPNDEYRMPNTDEYDMAPHYEVTTERIITFAKPTPPELSIDDPTICYFDLQDKTDGYIVSKATLYFYVQRTRVVQTTMSPVSVSRVVRINKGRAGLIKLDTVREEKLRLNTRHGEWHSVELTDVVVEWIVSPSTNAGLKIEVYDDEGNSVVITGLTDEDEPRKPFIQLRLHDARRRRSRRAAGLICSESQPEERCCRYPLRVVFADFQWDWILMPKAYEANYCSGLCPRMRLQQYSHTKIMSIMNPPPEGYMGPCCSASYMSPLTVLYFDDKQDIKYSLLNNMRVESCSCS